MFDIGFSELVMIGVVALIVIGPERLPKAARTAGHLFGRLQRYVADVKADINREMELEELKKLRQEVESAAQEMKSSVTSAAREVESQVRSVQDDFAGLSRAASGEGDAAPGAAPVGDTAPASRPPALADLPPLTEPPAAEPTAASTAESPRQAALPGFDKI